MRTHHTRRPTRPADNDLFDRPTGWWIHPTGPADQTSDPLTVLLACPVDGCGSTTDCIHSGPADPDRPARPADEDDTPAGRRGTGLLRSVGDGVTDRATGHAPAATGRPVTAVAGRSLAAGRPTGEHGRPRPVSAMRRHIGRLLVVFYVSFAGLATYGQSVGMMTWLNLDQPGIPVWAQHTGALAGGAAVELFAGVLLAVADWRQVEHGERVLLLRVTAYIAALSVAGLNWRAHIGAGDSQVFYVGVSLAAFLVVIVHTSARRRDALRARGELAAPPPVYPLDMWLSRDLRLTWEARRLAKSDPSLGLYGSLRAARAAREERDAQAAEANRLERERQRLQRMETLIAQHFDAKHPKAPMLAATEAAMYDAERITRDLAAHADYDAFVAGLLDQIGYRSTGRPTTAGDSPAGQPTATKGTDRSTDIPTDRTGPAEATDRPNPPAADRPQRPTRPRPTRSDRPTLPARSASRPANWGSALADAYDRLTTDLGRPPSGQALANAVGCTKSTANAWKARLKETR